MWVSKILSTPHANVFTERMVWCYRIGLTGGLGESRAASQSEFYIWHCIQSYHSIKEKKDVLGAAGNSEAYSWKSNYCLSRCTPESKRVTGNSSWSPLRRFSPGCCFCQVFSNWHGQYVPPAFLPAQRMKGFVDRITWSSLNRLWKIPTWWKKQCWFFVPKTLFNLKKKRKQNKNILL